MPYSNPVFNPSKSYAKEFEEKFGKDFELPTSEVIMACFHPTLLDHIVTLNKINEVKIKDEKVIVLTPDYLNNQFEEKIRDSYLDEARRHVAKRRSKFAKTISFTQGDEEEGYSLPSSPSSSEWEDFSEDYEGGEINKEETNQKEPAKDKNKSKGRRSVKVKGVNEFIIDKTYKVKGSYPKLKTKGAVIREQKEKMSNAENFNKA